jgi:uncharacterized membrane protein YbhN (UPF0104 family)
MAIFVFLSHLIYGYRFYLVVRKLSRKKIGLWACIKSVILNRFLSACAPQSGNLYQSVLLKKQYQVSYTQFVSSLVALTWFDTCLNLSLALAFILIINPKIMLGSFYASHVVGLLIMSILVVPLLIEYFLSKFHFQARFPAWLHGRLSELFSSVLSSIRDIRYLSHLLGTGLLSFLNTLVILYLCFKSIGISLDWAAIAFYHVILKLLNTILITPGNIGIREIAYGIISQQMNLSMGEGMNVSMVIRIIGMVVILTAGVLLGGHALLKQQKSHTTT